MRTGERCRWPSILVFCVYYCYDCFRLHMTIFAPSTGNCSTPTCMRTMRPVSLGDCFRLHRTVSFASLTGNCITPTCTRTRQPVSLGGNSTRGASSKYDVVGRRGDAHWTFDDGQRCTTYCRTWYPLSLLNQHPRRTKQETKVILGSACSHPRAERFSVQTTNNARGGILQARGDTITR